MTASRTLNYRNKYESHKTMASGTNLVTVSSEIQLG